MGEVKADPLHSAPAAPATLVDGPTDQELLEREEDEAEQEQEELEHVMMRHVHASKAWLFASILIILFIALLASVLSDSNMLFAILGFSPAILIAIIYIGLLEGEFKDVLFWLTPLVIVFLFLGLGPFLNEALQGQLDIPVLAALNLALSYIILAVMSMIEYRSQQDATFKETERFQPEQLDRYIHTIEDKCKALNFVIGRVYRASNGGTKEMRQQIKVPSEWYNEFNSIPTEEAKEQRQKALALLENIRERLSVMLRPEKDVFRKPEIAGLKHLARDPDGKDRVIDVLTVNDNDPVEDYFLGAMDFCKKITAELEKL